MLKAALLAGVLVYGTLASVPQALAVASCEAHCRVKICAPRIVGKALCMSRCLAGCEERREKGLMPSPSRRH